MKQFDSHIHRLFVAVTKSGRHDRRSEQDPTGTLSWKATNESVSLSLPLTYGNMRRNQAAVAQKNLIASVRTRTGTMCQHSSSMIPPWLSCLYCGVFGLISGHAHRLCISSYVTNGATGLDLARRTSRRFASALLTVSVPMCHGISLDWIWCVALHAMWCSFSVSRLLARFVLISYFLFIACAVAGYAGHHSRQAQSELEGHRPVWGDWECVSTLWNVYFSCGRQCCVMLFQLELFLPFMFCICVCFLVVSALARTYLASRHMNVCSVYVSFTIYECVFSFGFTRSHSREVNTRNSPTKQYSDITAAYPAPAFKSS